MDSFKVRASVAPPSAGFFVPDSWRFPHVQDKVELAQGTFESFVRQPGYFRDDVAGQKFRTEDYLMLDSRVPDFVTIAKAEELNIVFPDLTHGRLG